MKARELLKKAGALALAGVMTLSGMLAALPPITAQAAVSGLEYIDPGDEQDIGYKMSFDFLPNVTKAEPFGIPGGVKQTEVWRQATNNGYNNKNTIPILLSDAKRGNTGMLYKNVGTYNGQAIDFKVTLMDWKNPEERYDFQWAAAVTANKEPDMDWEDHFVPPFVSFDTKDLGMRIYCVDSVDVRYEYLLSGTNTPVTIPGHGTFIDLDGLQQVTFPGNCNIDHCYVTSDNQHISWKNGDTALATDAAIDDYNDKISWLMWEFNADQLNFQFGYPKKLEAFDDDRQRMIDEQGGDLNKFITSVKHHYSKDKSVATTYVDNYNGEKIFYNYAYFQFTSWSIGKYPFNPLAYKYVTDVGAMTSSDDRHENKEQPYRIYAYDDFEYQIDYEVRPAELSSFEFKDTLEDCLMIDDTHDVRITDINGKDVTHEFNVTWEDQTITAAAKASALKQDDFTDNDTYTFHIKAHRKEGASVKDWLEEDGYTFTVPNKATVALVRTDGERELVETNPSWVQGKIVSDLQVDKFAQYEWEVGDEVDYTVKVFQKEPNAWAINTVLTDISIPEGLEVISYEVDGPHNGAEHCKITKTGTNGWTATCPLLQYDESMIVTFKCKATEAVNGTEMLNTATATAENFFDEYTGDVKSASGSADVWINTPHFSIDKGLDKNRYEWQVGDEVTYTVTVNNTTQKTVAKNVVISDLSLPNGLKLKLEDPVVEGIPATIQYPVSDDATGFAFEELQNEYAFERQENGWILNIKYLPDNTPVKITFVCEATEEVNGAETQNQASVYADNAEETWDDAEVFVNTAYLEIEKTADHYEWMVGEDVLYNVTVNNTFPGTIGRNVVIYDTDMPSGLALNPEEDAITVNGIPATYEDKIPGTPDFPSQLDEQFYNETEEKPITPELIREGNGWKLTIDNLPYNTPVSIDFKCKAEWNADGHESINTATVMADNGEKKQDDAEVFVNTAVLNLDKTFTNPYLDLGDGREAHEFRVGETVDYTVVVKNVHPDSIGRNVVIDDTSLPEGLALNADENAISISHNLPATIEYPVAGTDDPANQKDPDNYGETETRDITIDTVREGTGFKTTISYLPYNEPVTITYHCTATEAVNGWEVINNAYAKADNAAEVTDNTKVWINSPVLNIVKEADKPEYKYGDIATYYIDVTQDMIGCVARNVVISDVIDTAGVKLQKDSIVLLDKDGRKFNDADIEVVGNSFVVRTHMNMVKEGNYSIWDAANGGLIEQSKWNPLGQTAELKFTIEYQMAIVDHALAGQTVHNTATATSDENIPKDDDETIDVHAPALDIVKESDKKAYHIGEEAQYKLTVRQIREDVIAENVVIADKFQVEGAIVDVESVAVFKNLVPVDAVITADGNNGFVIETHEDMRDTDKIEVYYDVLFEDVNLQYQDVENVATAWADNAPEEKQNNIVTLEDILPRIRIEKESDKQAYKLGEVGHYTVKVTQTEADAIARNLIIKDEIQVEGAKIVPGSVTLYNTAGAVLSGVEIQYSDSRYAIFTGMDLHPDEVFTVTYDVLFEQDSLVGQDILNIARATADNAVVDIPDNSNPVDITDGLQALKTAAVPSGSVVKNGDVITYSIEVRNTSSKDKDNILIKDAIPAHTLFVDESQTEQPADRIMPNLMTLNGVQYATFIVPGLAAGESKTVSFQVQVTDAPEDGMIVNTAMVRETRATIQDMNEDTWTHDGFKYTNETVHFLDTRWVMDSNTVNIIGGNLTISKESDKMNYAVGETGHYTLTVSQTRSGAISKNVVVTDELFKDGALIQKDTIKAYYEKADAEEAELIEDAVLTTSKDYRFVLETGHDLAYGDRILVKYDVLFKDPSLENSMIKNVASAKDDATEEGEEPTDDNRVTVGDAGLIIEKTSDKRSYQIGETAHYTLKVYPSDPKAAIENVMIKDVMKQEGANLIAGTVRVYLDGVEQKVSVDEKNNGFMIATGITLTGSHVITVNYDVTMEDAKLSGRDIINNCTTWGDNTEPSDDEHTVTIGGKPVDPGDPGEPEEPDVPAKPGLTIAKTSDADTYKVGDTAKYTLTIKTTNEESVPNVVVEDTISTTGVALQKDTIKVFVGNKEIDPSSVNATENGFTVKTGYTLKSTDTMKVTYDVLMEEESLGGSTIHNEATASGTDVNRVNAKHSVKIPAPEETKAELNISKRADKSSYKVGDTAKYTLTVKNIGKETAKAVVVTDTLKTSGVTLDESSIKVTVDNKQVSDAVINATSTGFTVRSNTDLEPGKTMVVTYNVKFGKDSLKGSDIINAATADSENTDQASTENSVSIPADVTTTPKPDGTTGKTTTTTTTTTGNNAMGAKTGDEGTPWYVTVIALVAIGGLVGGGVYATKKKQKK